jgi:hypothetical protein
MGWVAVRSEWWRLHEFDLRNAMFNIDALRLHLGHLPPMMQDGLRLAGYCSFMGSVSCFQTIHDIVDHEESWSVLFDSDSHGRSLVQCLSAGGHLRVFWRSLASLPDHIRDHLHTALSKSDWRGVTPIECSTQQGDPLESSFFIALAYHSWS